MTDDQLKQALDQYVASQPPANPGAVNWTLLLPLLRMILPLVLPTDVMAKIREWINQVFPV